MNEVTEVTVYPVELLPSTASVQPQPQAAIDVDVLVQSLPRYVRRLLTDGETVGAVARQVWLLSPVCPDFVIITSRRILLCHRGIFGQLKSEDFLWQEVVDVNVRTYTIGAEITIDALRRQPDDSFRAVSTRLTGLNKQHALTLYAGAQAMEQQWKEKQRVRKMEEERARAGGVYLGAWQPGYAGTSPAPGYDVEARLTRLRHLNELQLITDSEYEARKAQIVGEI